jgi:hypothetical protein
MTEEHLKFPLSVMQDLNISGPDLSATQDRNISGPGPVSNIAKDFNTSGPEPASSARLEYFRA